MPLDVVILEFLLSRKRYQTIRAVWLLAGVVLLLHVCAQVPGILGGGSMDAWRDVRIWHPNRTIGLS